MTLKIQRQNISHQIFEKIKSMIKDGTFEVNTKLPSENKLAKMFQVSRSPVREAISILAASGIVESKQGGGNWVRKVDFASMLQDISIDMVEVIQVNQLLEFRTIIESEAAALAAERYNKSDIEKLENALNILKKNTLNDEEIIGDDADFNFHSVIVNASKNPFLVQTINNISDLYQKTLKLALKQHVEVKYKREKVLKQHIDIFKAIKDRDSESAAFYMKKHLQMARTNESDRKSR